MNNFAPLLFLTFQSTYEISLDKIALLVSFNFGVQLIVDLLAAKYVDRIGYRISIVAAHIMASAGLVGMGLFPFVMPDPYLGLLAAIVLNGIGGVSVRFSGCVCRTASGSILLCNWRRIDRGADQSDCRILSDRAKGCCDESSAFFLLLGACRRDSDLDCIFCHCGD